jgi:CBS domain-containing protein
MQLKEIMTHQVHCVPPETSLREAAQEMRLLDVGALPICKDDRLIGFITDRDIAVRAVADGQDPRSCCVSDAMTPELVYCFEDDEVEEAARLMETRQIRRLPVLSRNKRLVGIVSLGDLAIRHGDESLSHEVLEQISQPSQLHG